VAHISTVEDHIMKRTRGLENGEHEGHKTKESKRSRQSEESRQSEGFGQSDSEISPILKPLSPFILTKDLDRSLFELVTPQSIESVFKLNSHYARVYAARFAEWNKVKNSTEPLIDVCKAGYTWIFKYLIEKYIRNTDVTEKYSYTNTYVNHNVFSICGSSGAIAIIKHLVKSGIPIIDIHVKTAMENAAYYGHLDVLIYLEEAFSLDVSDYLIYCRMGNRLDIIKYIIGKTSAPKVIEFIKSFSILPSCVYGNIGLIRYVIGLADSYGMRVDIHGPSWTATLEICCNLAYVELGKYLIDLWADGYGRRPFGESVDLIDQLFQLHPSDELEAYVREAYVRDKKIENANAK